MKHRADILTELNDLGSPLAGFSALMPFAVPEGYFSVVADEMIAGTLAARANADPALLLPRTSPFIIPAGYFETLPEQLLIAAKQEEHEGVLPVIGQAFEVPSGYFDTLAAQLLQKAKEAEGIIEVERPARVLAMPAYRPVLRWAAAAILVLGVGFGGYRYFTQTNSDATAQLAKLGKQEVYQYVQQNIEDFEEDAMIAVASKANASRADAGMDLDLEEQEIIDYLDQTGWEESETTNDL